MKRVIQFDKGFLITTIISVVLIAIGLIGYATMGFNLGVDYKAGINQYVQLAYPALELGYSGKGNAVLSVSDKKTATLVFSGAEVEARTLTFNLGTGTIDNFAAELGKIESVTVKVLEGGSLQANLLVPTYQGDFNLSSGAVVIHREPRDQNEIFAPMEKVRAATNAMGTVSVQALGDKLKQQYIIRLQDDKKDASFGMTASSLIRTSLEKEFGSGRVVVMKTDTVDQAYSKGMAQSSIAMVLLTLGAILIYATFRFKLEYALGAVIAIAHDALIMVGFIVWTRMEFNITSIAAILTILGYSINDTIVIFDRVRENRKLRPKEPLVQILNESITETLSRTFITVITTMVAVLSLFIFTTDKLKDFALALIVGMVSGTYSTIFMASAFVKLWEDIKAKREAKRAAHGTLQTKPATK